MGDLLVLCYHGLSESWPAPTTVRPADFASQLQAFLHRGYRGVTLGEALLAPASAKSLVVTFDDAHRSVLELAAPVMANLGVPGTVYVPTGYATSQEPMGWDGYDGWMGGEFESELRCMAWDELAGLVEAGWEVGSHTVSHPHLPRLGDDELAAELAESKAECEDRLRIACRALAYPYSDYDARVVRAAEKAGYGTAVVVPRGPFSPRPLEWPRVGVYRDEDARRVVIRSVTRRLGPSVAARAALLLRRFAR